MNVEDRGYIHRILYNAIYIFANYNHKRHRRMEHKNAATEIPKVETTVNPTPDGNAWVVESTPEQILKDTEIINAAADPEQQVKQYKGVTFIAENTNKKWRAAIDFMGKSELIGHYETEIEAARAFNGMAKLYYGKSAELNDV